MICRRGVSDEVAAAAVSHSDTGRCSLETRRLRARDVLCGEKGPQDRRLPELVRRSPAEPFILNTSLFSPSVFVALRDYQREHMTRIYTRIPMF